MQNELEKGILRYVDSSIENAPYTQIYTGLIKASGIDGYTIDLNGVEYTNVPSEGSFSTNDTVKVVIPNNQPSNMFILAEPIGGGGGTGAVSSVNGMTGDVVISNVSSADKLDSAKTITLSGDATGSVSTDFSTNPTISVTVVDDSHNHIISNVDGLQTALDGKSNIGHYHATDRDRANHTGTQLASTISDFASTVRSTVLTGLSTATNVIISATDTVLSALGKLQAQITANLSTLTTHIGRTNNPHSVTKTQVGLGNVDNTSDATKNVLSATKLATARTISLSGDVTGSVSFDGSGNSNIVATVADDSHNHVISNVDNLQTTLNVKADLVDGKVPSSQLPSFVDDVLEYATLLAFPVTGTSGVIYIDLSTNLAYRWSGTVYVEISPSLALGETSSTAYRGDRGVIAYNHSLSTSNPHNTTASQVGLGNVDNTKDINKDVRSAERLRNLFTTRPTSANLTITGDGSLKEFKATSSMTDGKPLQGGHVLHFEWDNIGGYNSQLAIENTTGNLYFRGMVGGVWQPWYMVYSQYSKQPDVAKLTTARTISLTGDVTGSVSFDGSANVSITSTVADDSHNHVISNVDNLQTTLNVKADLVDGKVPSSQLPSFVDDVLEYATLSAFPVTGTSGVIYIDLSTNLAYRWSGTVYVEISPSLALGETSSTAYRGDRGVIAYNHSLSTSNPHSTTASQVGLGNVDNTKDINKDVRSAERLRNLFTTRPTSANLTITGDGSLKEFKATSSMTDGKPLQGGHVLHFEWDNIGGYNSQLAIENTTGNLYFRGMVGGVWQPWYMVYSQYSKQPDVAKLTTARTISLTGDVTGSVSFDGSANVSITSTVADDSHNHVISNVDNLQTTLDSKLNSSAYNATDVLTKIKTVDGSGSGLDADTVDTYHVNNALNTGSLWTSDKILSTIKSYGSHIEWN